MLTAEALAEPALTPHVAEYKIRISVLGGKLRTEFRTTDGGYAAQSAIRATGMSRMFARGSIEESSDFSVYDDGIRPDRYRSTDTLSKDGQAVDLVFDWGSQVASGTIDGGPFSTELAGLVHDRVSLQYGLMHDLLNGIERDEYLLQDAEELKQLSITNAGTKTVRVPYGEFEAVGIQHQAQNSSRITTLWCVEALGFLPVVIEQHRKGKLRVRAELTEYAPLETVAASSE